MFQPSYLPEIQIWLVSGYSRLIESRKKNESLQHKSTRWRCEILGKWTTIASSKTWAGSATNMWTRCPRQAWPQSSLIIKHYRVQEGEPSTRVSKSLHKSGLALMKELLLLEQINQWLGVLGYTYRMEVANLQTTEYFARMHDWLGMIPEEAKQTFSNSRRQLASNAHELEEVTSYIRHMLHELAWTNAFKSFQH
mgnify:CR=1 FL=1